MIISAVNNKTGRLIRPALPTFESLSQRALAGYQGNRKLILSFMGELLALQEEFCKVVKPAIHLIVSEKPEKPPADAQTRKSSLEVSMPTTHLNTLAIAP